MSYFNTDQQDAMKPHKCFGLNQNSTHCGQCGWPLNERRCIVIRDTSKLIEELEATAEVRRTFLSGDMVNDNAWNGQILGMDHAIAIIRRHDQEPTESPLIADLRALAAKWDRQWQEMQAFFGVTGYNIDPNSTGGNELRDLIAKHQKGA